MTSNEVGSKCSGTWALWRGRATVALLPIVNTDGFKCPQILPIGKQLILEEGVAYYVGNAVTRDRARRLLQRMVKVSAVHKDRQLAGPFAAFNRI